MNKDYIRLGVNIDHVATIRNARGGEHPDPVRAAIAAAEAGADGITAHLREDRRHISDRDIERLKEEVDLPLNLEMATTDEMLAIAMRTIPHACCIVPEKRQELTTEGGLDVVSQRDLIKKYIRRLREANIRVSLFIDANKEQIDAAVECGAQVVELHTGKYCEAHGEEKLKELNRIVAAAAYTKQVGIECHAGHGLSYQTVMPIASIPEIVELNIGHFLIGEAIFSGLDEAIREMRSMMDYARNIKGNTGL